MRQVYDVTSIHMYMYEHGRHVAIKRMRKQCVPGPLSSPPPHLGMRLDCYPDYLGLPRVQ